MQVKTLSEEIKETVKISRLFLRTIQATGIILVLLIVSVSIIAK